MTKKICFVLALAFFAIAALGACTLVIDESSKADVILENSDIVEKQSYDESRAVYHIEWEDMIVIGGKGYLNDEDEVKKATAEEIGDKLGTIAYVLPTDFGRGQLPSVADMTDFTASYLEIGTEVFALKDSENIAVKSGDEYIVYVLYKD